LEFTNILILQTAFLGDLILTTPIITALKNRYPDASISLLTTPEGARLFTLDERLTRVLTYDKRGKEKGIRGFLKIVDLVRKGGYDLAVVPHRSIRSALIPLLGRVRFRIGFDTSAGWFLFSMAIPYAEREHEVVRNLRLIAPLDPHHGDLRPELRLPGDDRAWAERFLLEAGIDPERIFLTVAPGSIWPTKRWTGEGYGSLVRMALDRYPVVLIGGDDDQSLAYDIICSVKEENGNLEGLVSAVGLANPLQSAAIIARSSLLVTNDSAPLHMGVAVETPVCAIFGPTSPEFGFYPLGENDRVIQRDLPCRPCRIHGSRTCPEDHFRCMLEIRPEEVFESIEQILADRS
jgi:heptosyltransferase-2